MSLIARKPTKKFDNNFTGTSVLGFVLRSNYKATVLQGTLIVAFAGRLSSLTLKFHHPSVRFYGASEDVRRCRMKDRKTRVPAPLTPWPVTQLDQGSCCSKTLARPTLLLPMQCQACSATGPPWRQIWPPWLSPPASPASPDLLSPSTQEGTGFSVKY